MAADTIGTGSASNWMDKAAAAGDHPASMVHTGTWPLVAMAMPPAQVTWPAGCERQQVNGSRSHLASRPAVPCMVPVQQPDAELQNCHTGEDSAQAMKSLPVNSGMS